MFARKSCYCFVRPKRSFLEVCIFLPRAVRGPQVRRSDRTSGTKVANMLRIHHRDEVEAPITDWLEEAFELSAPSERAAVGRPTRKRAGKQRPQPAHRRTPATKRKRLPKRAK